MAIQNINDYGGMWMNGVNVGELWDKIKQKFVAGFPGVSGGDPAIDQTGNTEAWRQQARTNLGLNIGVDQIWYGNGANLVSRLDVSPLGKWIIGSSINVGKMWYGVADDTIGANIMAEVTTTPFGRGLLNTSSNTMISGLYADKAKNDENGNQISTNYASDVAFNTSSNNKVQLKSKSGAFIGTGIATNTAGGLLKLDSTGNGKIPITHIPDAILGQLTYGGNITSYGTVSGVEYVGVSMTDSAKTILSETTGKTFGTKAVRLVAEDKSSASFPSDTGSELYFNYEDCKGMYFIWTGNALATHSGETEKWRRWPDSAGNPRYQAGDWMNSLESKWDKVDNTDAVTGVKGIMESTYRLSNVDISALNVGALATYATTSGQQSVADNVQFNHNVWALGGMAAHGLTDMGIFGGGGSGTVTSIQIDDAEPIASVGGLITVPLGTPSTFGTFVLGGKEIAVYGLKSFAYIDALSLTDSRFTNADDIKAIQAISTGSAQGFLKRASNGTWSFDTTTYASSSRVSTLEGYFNSGGIAKNADKLDDHDSSYFATASSLDNYVLTSSVKSLTIKGGTDTAVTYSPTANSASELTIAAGTNIGVSVSGSTITIANSYSLPAASADALGGIKIADPFKITSGVLGIGNGKITNAMLAGSIANSKLSSGGKFTIGSQDIELGTTYTQANMRTYLGLGTVSTHDHTDYVTNLSWDSTNNKLAWSKGGNAQDGITIGYATNADTVDTHHASEFVGTLGTSGNYLTWTRIGGTAQNITVPYATNADTLDGVHANQLFSALTNYGDKISVTVGGTNKQMTVPYASKTSRFKTEPKDDQEFVYRQSPQTIDADSLKLDRILGRTLVWNQMIGIPSSSKTTTVNNVTITDNRDGSYKLNGTASATGYLLLIAVGTLIATHKYYIAAIGNNSACEIDISGYDNWASMPATTTSVVRTCDTTYTNGAVEILFNANNVFNNVVIRPIIVDLTLLYGSEIDGMTDAQILAKFESEYPGYHSYNAGQLINNAAEGLETVGFNQWDEEWEVGSINSSTGANTTYSNSIRTKNYIPIEPNANYYSNKLGLVCFYNSNKDFISSISLNASGNWSSPSNAKYVRQVFKDAYGTIYNHDICINLSDTSRNGQYEPYKRNVLDLHLDNIQVKSPNLWDEEWEVGGIDSSGQSDTSTSRFRSKNYTRIIPGSSYNLHYGSASTNVQMLYYYYYDVNKNFISSDYIYSVDNVITVPANAYFIRFRTGGTTPQVNYAHDICINKSDPAFNGKYFPHGILTFNGLNSSTLAISPYTEKIDEISSDGRRFIRRNARYKMKDLTWSYLSGNRFYAKAPYSEKVNSIPFISSKYEKTNATQAYVNDPDKTIWTEITAAVTDADTIHVRDSSASENTTTFVNNLGDAEIVFALAQEEVYELISPLPTAMPAGTTERRLPEDTSDSVLAPFACDMTYGTNPGDILASGIAWEKIWGRPQLAKGTFSDTVINPSASNNGVWFNLDVGDTTFYVQFSSETGAFRLTIADDKTNPTMSKGFTFATLDTAAINAICV